RDDVDGEGHAAVGEALDLVHGQRDAVERDRALGGDIGAELPARDHADAPRIADLLDRRDLADPVDMAGDDMPAELVADLERALEVDLRAFGPEAGRSAALGLGRDVDREPALALVDDGQADAR